MNVRIQYFSDIHLEFGSIDWVSAGADVVVAAGDIGVGAQGLQWLKKIPKPVIYVAGNHEFYGHDHGETLKALQEGAARSNVNFLEKATVVLGGVRFIGCTLWTELGGEENNRLVELLHTVNDFRKIRCRGKAFSFSEYVTLHRDCRSWLVQELQQPFDGPTVVVTHHAPTHWSWRESPGNIRRYAYCNDLKELFHNHEIAAWIHGHVHEVSDYRCAGAAIVCNPRGYYPDHLVPRFDIGRVVEV